ncbi:MAG: hypothetical protein ABJA74_06160 [Lapillicoccus sp.]
MATDPCSTVLAELLLATPTLEQFLDQLAHVAASSITPAVSCGITLRRKRRTGGVVALSARCLSARWRRVFAARCRYH